MEISQVFNALTITVKLGLMVTQVFVAYKVSKSGMFFINDATNLITENFYKNACAENEKESIVNKINNLQRFMNENDENLALEDFRNGFILHWNALHTDKLVYKSNLQFQTHKNIREYYKKNCNFQTIIGNFTKKEQEKLDKIHKHIDREKLFAVLLPILSGGYAGTAINLMSTPLNIDNNYMILNFAAATMGSFVAYKDIRKQIKQDAEKSLELKHP
jgi:hypothetical protein